jgi:pyruvate dehydrogenase E1 component alpha subunit
LTEISEKACSYEIPTSIVDGQDALETFVAFQGLAEEVRNGGGPRFVDLRTYRFKGHSMSDPVSGTYRSKEEVDGKVKEADPIALLRDTLTQSGHLTQELLEEMDTEAKETAQDAFDFADESPLPDEETLYTDVYAGFGHGRLFLDDRERPEGLD